jgi:hypothetical protein
MYTLSRIIIIIIIIIIMDTRGKKKEGVQEKRGWKV